MMLAGSTDQYTKALARTRHWRLAVDAWINVLEMDVLRSTREAYRQAAGLLARAKSAAARRGEEMLVTKVADDWRYRYPRRLALLEELEKAGL